MICWGILARERPSHWKALHGLCHFQLRAGSQKYYFWCCPECMRFLCPPSLVRLQARPCLRHAHAFWKMASFAMATACGSNAFLALTTDGGIFGMPVMVS